MQLISHRGAAGIAEQNSYDAIQKAKAYNPACIEIDVHRTSDGVFIVFHGEIKQTYTGNDRSETFEQLKALHPHLLRLDELLVKDDASCPFMFDIKCNDSIDDLITFLKEATMPSNVFFTAPHIEAIIQLKKAFPTAKTFVAQKFIAGPFKAHQLATKHHLDGVSLSKWWLNPITYRLCIRNQKHLMIYTVDSLLGMKIINKLYDRVMLCTNYPNRFVSAFSKK